MPRASTQNARPALRRLPTRASRIVQAVVSRLLPLLFRGQGLEIRNGNAANGLARAFAAQQSGASNLLIAFRHPSTRDPVVLADLFWNRVPEAARRLKLPLARPIQLRFLYDRGIPIWAGPVIGWLLQRSGGIAIHRGRLDRPALSQARAALAQGRYPLVVAPEGATNNLSGEMAPLEPGVAQLAFWAAEDLEKAGDARQLEVLPVGIQYSWRKHNWGALDARLNALERHLGIPTAAVSPGNLEINRRERLIEIGMNLLKALEQLERLKPDPEKSFSERIGAYRLHGLAKAEAHFALRAVGNLQERCRRIEQAAWDRIYREGVDQLPPLERSVADWEAREADLQLTRMRLVEHFTSVSGHYISDRSDFDRFAEMLLLVEEAIGWIEDKPWKGQPSLGPQRVELRLGRALPVRPRLNGYLRNRRESMQLFMEDLEQALIEVMPDTAL
ncbi:glycerol acyltransferase [Synechococcus sp. HB1133]|uniref:lysophospholipid acyltransferase family protein n=1 Tax=unclassified Synechococcus TaxID=2626047 RepID=UPI00140E5A26|nr:MULTISPECIES: 1-acyl-sn-glycerol-3-phosphate acyltransferase [unclassified Synechococcus]MCB4395188.1 glycerol acyltransferase [Synechococcus sp. PH41509]MCB4422352.1 glycerol acyltransferase [Synechococcus sp. HB1133]MCB4429544.1 glycerol acyltransferase [Synechococcus sp. HBA1120]NHI81296.1 glycerol acyltransferase [Synechococcus sp. HB1133]